MEKTKYQNSYDQYAKEIYRFSMFKLNNKEQAEDLTSEVFEELFKSDLSRINNIRAWLYRTTRNLLYDRFYRSKDLNYVYTDDGYSVPKEFLQAETSSTLETEVINTELVKIIEKEMSNLAPMEQDIIVMRVWDEMKFSEISQVLNENEDTIKRRFYRSIDKIRLNLEQSDPSYKKYSFAIPLIFGGILSMSKASAFAPSAGFLSSTLSSLLKTSSMVGATSGGFALFGLSGTKIALTIGSLLAVASAAIIGVVALSEDKKDDNLDQVVESYVEEEIPDCNVVTQKLDPYPNFSIDYEDCKWVSSFNQESKVLKIESKTDDSEIQLTFSDVPGVGFSGQCYTDSFIEFSPGLIRSSNSDKYVYLDKKLDFAAKDTTEYKNLINDINSLRTPTDPIDESNLTYCVSIFRGFSTDRGNENRSLISVVAKTNDPIAIEDIDQVIKTIKTTLNTTEICVKTYSNSKFPTLSFEYDSCEWELTEDISPKAFGDDDVTLGTLKLASDETLITFEFKPYFLYSPGWFCSSDDFTRIQENISRYKLSNEVYEYVNMDGYIETANADDATKGSANFDTSKKYCYSNMNPWSQFVTGILNKDIPYAYPMDDYYANYFASASVKVLIEADSASELDNAEDIIKTIEIKGLLSEGN
jgi:RNA polymerase sigma-70 factor (ECF subfamily)